MKKISILFYLLFALLSMSCDNTVRCQRHFLPNGFIGKVTIYFNQKGGQKEFDKDGCVMYRIGSNGDCKTSLQFEQGSAYPNNTYKYFEVNVDESVNQIFEFYENEYLKDTLNNRYKKYIYYHSSGYTAPNYTFEYFVDYGVNYKKYLFY
ncbi:DUF6843 domain-containing protein [Flavihumibacter sp. UBA7668]|uniref:DUF6843 domain-containing protein n=1 Tax=Flavihumibacter sp. UBA7668 TaxID=1946542 RepID=UPI0025C23585|nr:hypothetical protein [Flavihumibacter sp. UBA7668]